MLSNHKIQAWTMLFSVTLVSATIQLLITQSSSIYIQMSLYMRQYHSQNPRWVLNEQSVFYIVLMPAYLYFMNKYSIKIIKHAAYFVMLSSITRCIAANNYNCNYINNLIIAILRPLIVMLPFSLLSSFSNQNRLYAALIPLFLPKAMVKLSHLFKHKYIVGAFTLSHGGTNYYIEQLSVVTALLAIASGAVTNAMLAASESKQQKQQVEVAKCSVEIKQRKQSILILILWGIIIGSERMFSKYLYENYMEGNSTSQLIVIDIFIDLLSVLASYQIFRLFSLKFKNQLTLLMSIIGVFGLLLCQATLHTPFKSKAIIILILAVIRVGLLSFASPAISQFQPSIISATIMLYAATVTEQLFIFSMDNTNLPSKALIVIVSIIICQIIRQSTSNVPRGQNKIENTYFEL